MNLISILLGLTIIGVYFFVNASKKTRQLNYIDRYYFHKGIRSKLLQKHPQLTEQQADTVFKGLRDYFRVCHMAKKRMVSMPSQIVDDVWHEFILSTRIYDNFCAKAFGRFLHHTPAEAMQMPTKAQEGIKRAWRLSCSLEKINPKHPDRLPLLFAIDSLLQIENGFIYQLNCSSPATNRSALAYCASHIGCTSGCSGDSGGVFDSLSDTSSVGEDGGSGCSGGCSGGCGGGGD